MAKPKKKQTVQTIQPTETAKLEKPTASHIKGWTANFLSNVLGVIVGIVLTFGGNALIQQHNEKQEIHTMLTLIGEEITYNKNEFVSMQNDYLKTKKACNIFMSHDWRTMPQDSVWRHVENAMNMYGYTARHTAWNVFQKSNIFTTVNDKKLLVYLSTLYTLIEECMEWWEIHQTERSLTSDIFYNNYYYTEKNNLFASVDAMLKNEATRKFLNHPYSYEDIFTNVIDLADYMLYLIDKSCSYQSELKSIDEDFENFRKNKKK
ncbi:MAG: hypothetical protein LBP63_02615 [Prevotellaceae bacterium]|jgi:hypothetical protein|nr:hypothetical protein [Prevotellaceae bacterium]